MSVDHEQYYTVTITWKNIHSARRSKRNLPLNQWIPRRNSDRDKAWPPNTPSTQRSWRWHSAADPHTGEQYSRIGTKKVKNSNEVTRRCSQIYTERIACILCMHLGACRFFTHPTALMHLKKLILRKCIQLHFIFLAPTRMGSHWELL